MSLPQSLKVYDDVRIVLDQMLEHTGGKIPCGSHKEATALRAKFNYFRVLDRRFNAQIYPPDHPMNGKSPYDCFMFRIEPGSDTVIVQTRSVVKPIVFIPDAPEPPKTDPNIMPDLDEVIDPGSNGPDR